MGSLNEVAPRGMGQSHQCKPLRKVSYSNYRADSHLISKTISEYHFPEDADFEIYEHIIKETGNEDYASKYLYREERHQQAVRLSEYRRNYNKIVREDRQRVSDIRDELGHDIVNQIQLRRRAAKKDYIARFMKDDFSGHDAALARWDAEAKELERLYGIVNAAKNLRFEQSIRMELERRQKERTAEESKLNPTFSLPKTIDVNRNITLFKSVCSDFARGHSSEAVWAALEIENHRKCYEPLSESELRQLFKSAEKMHLRNEEIRTKRVRLSFTDTANGDKLVEDHGERIRFIQSLNKWVQYDGIRWLFEPPGGLYPLVRLTIEGLYQFAITLEGDERIATVKQIATLESVTKQKAMIEMASKVPGVIIPQETLDHNTFLLNLHNGTLDLKTGILREHRSEDFISKLVPVSYDPLAKCPVWLSFLDRIMDSNQSLIGFLQRAIGYCLTGDTSEQCFFILYGCGANGKSTLMNIIRLLLADYAAQAAPEILMAKDRQTGASPDLARLPGVRFLATSEADDNQRFAEATLKQMTGQDTITARFLYGEFFEYRPQFKIFFGTNHKPVIKGTENAIWRRVHLIPFTVTISPEEQDRDLERKLVNELPGILNWSLTGCIGWQNNGLQPPDEVKAAVNEYRKDMDYFSQWLDERCIQRPEIVTLQRDLYSSYKEWSEDNIGWSLTPQKFGRILVERGFTRELKPAAAYRGIGLLVREDCPF